MIELWHCADARSFRPLWMLEEMGLDYRLHLLPFPPRWHQPTYLETNPLGTVPYFKDDHHVLTESTAIVQYLAETHGSPLRVEPSEPDFGAYLNLMFQSDATFTFPQTLVLRYRLLEPTEKRLPAVADSYAKWFWARMQWVETLLEDDREWLVAGRFTAADIAVGYAVLLANSLGIAKELGPKTQNWWSRCTKRDGYQRAKSAQTT